MPLLDTEDTGHPRTTPTERRREITDYRAGDEEA